MVVDGAAPNRPGDGLAAKRPLCVVVVLLLKRPPPEEVPKGFPCEDEDVPNNPSP